MGRAALASQLVALTATERSAWRVGEMKTALRLGGVASSGVTEKDELVALVEQLIIDEGVTTDQAAQPARDA